MIYVTGGSGFVGTHIINKLIDNGEVFENIDLKVDKDIFKISSLEPESVVIHLAAISSINESFEDISECLKTNLIGTQKVIEACQLSKSKIIFASSSSVVDPKSPYAYTKLWAESLIKNSDIDYSILRFGNVYGDGDYKSAIDIFLKAKEITIFGDGKQIRSFVHVSDIVNGILSSISLNNGTYDIGTENLDINTVASYFKKPIKYGPSRMGDAYKTPQNPNIFGKVKLKDWVESQL